MQIIQWKKNLLVIEFAECDFKNDLKIIWPHSVESLGQLYNQMLQEMPSYITFHQDRRKILKSGGASSNVMGIISPPPPAPRSG